MILQRSIAQWYSRSELHLPLCRFYALRPLQWRLSLTAERRLNWERAQFKVLKYCLCLLFLFFGSFLPPPAFHMFVLFLHTYTYLTGTMGFSIIIPNISDFKCVSVSRTKIRLPGQGESPHSTPSEWLGQNEHLECILGFFTWWLIDPRSLRSSRTIKTC